MEISEEKLPGTYRVEDLSPVSFSVARKAWAELAYEELRDVANRYHAVTTYKELAETVQERSGIRTRVLLTNWIGKLLEDVAKIAKAAGEPPLTALCVRQDGTIGPGYALAPKSVETEPGDDIELYAAEHRLLCYQRYAADLPEDGGTPALTRAVQLRRQQKRSADAAPVVKVCDNCFTALPATGACDYCA